MFLKKEKRAHNISSEEPKSDFNKIKSLDGEIGNRSGSSIF